MAMLKPEMKSFIWLETSDGLIQQVEEEVAMFCPMIRREVFHKSMGSSKNHAIKLPDRVTPAVLGLILDYCRFHQVAGRSNKERKTFDEKFMRLDANKLCDLVSAADSLQVRPLVDLTSCAIARMISGKTAEEIRETFHIADDLTEEEKLEPIKFKTDDSRVRLLNRLYARKRKQLKAREKSKNVEVEEEPVEDRSVDDLLSFINSGDEDSKGVKPAKNKKRNRRRKHHRKDPSPNTENKNNYKETDSLSSSHNSEIEDARNQIICSELLGYASAESDFDDGLDPALREQLDREVEDFAQRLNSVWSK
ncbi:SKP1-like protein 21 isoform X2 [Bidens hawaiensis]|uniref:SKP1-like protein 21 isoform X2 n=1 Tax=Bidens hawaiensis TaxID=980011 RepID=UPI00404919FE